MKDVNVLKQKKLLRRGSALTPTSHQNTNWLFIQSAAGRWFKSSYFRKCDLFLTITWFKQLDVNVRIFISNALRKKKSGLAFVWLICESRFQTGCVVVRNQGQSAAEAEAGRRRNAVRDDECWSEVHVLIVYLDVHIMLYILPQLGRWDLVGAGLSWSLRSLLKKIK